MPVETPISLGSQRGNPLIHARIRGEKNETIYKPHALLQNWPEFTSKSTPIPINSEAKLKSNSNHSNQIKNSNNSNNEKSNRTTHRVVMGRWPGFAGDNAPGLGNFNNIQFVSLIPSPFLTHVGGREREREIDLRSYQTPNSWRSQVIPAKIIPKRMIKKYYIHRDGGRHCRHTTHPTPSTTHAHAHALIEMINIRKQAWSPTFSNIEK